MLCGVMFVVLCECECFMARWFGLHRYLQVMIALNHVSVTSPLLLLYGSQGLRASGHIAHQLTCHSIIHEWQCSRRFLAGKQVIVLGAHTISRSIIEGREAADNVTARLAVFEPAVQAMLPRSAGA